MMAKSLVGLLVAMSAVGLIAGDVNMSGRVTNKQGQPIEGAIVNVVGLNLMDVTDAQGNYSIQGSSPVYKGIEHTINQSIRLRDGNLLISLAKRTEVPLSE